MSGNFVCDRIFQKLRANICWMYGTVYRVVQDPTIVGQRLLDHAKIHRWLDVSMFFTNTFQSRWVLNDFK